MRYHAPSRDPDRPHQRQPLQSVHTGLPSKPGIDDATTVTPPPSMTPRRGESGFTLIELIVVIAIIGILATIAMPAMKNAPQRAREAVLKEDLYQMRSSIDQYLADKGHYPGSLEELVTEGYLRRMPEDPITKSSETWKVDYATADEDEDLQPNGENGGSGPGIIDVHSGAPGNGLDGTPYSEW